MTMGTGSESISDCICNFGYYLNDEASCTRCPVATSSIFVGSTSLLDCSMCDTESSRDVNNGNCGVHLCQQIVVRGDENSPNYSDLPNSDIFRKYSLTPEVHGGSPVYMTSDAVFTIRYHGSDNTWKLQNSMRTAFVTVHNAKETPHGSPEKDYRCSFTGDEERWCGDIVSINCVDFEVDTTLLPYAPTSMFVATQEERVLATDHGFESYTTFVDYDGSYKGESEQTQLLFLSSFEFLVTDGDRGLILRYDVSGELLHMNRNITNPTAMLKIGGGEVLVLNGKNKPDSSTLAIVDYANGAVVSNEVELSMGASSEEIEATSMCLGRGERWKQPTRRRRDINMCKC